MVNATTRGVWSQCQKQNNVRCKIMSKTESSNNNGLGRSGHDPVAGAFLAMRDAWLEGIAAMAGAMRPTAVGGNSGAGLPGEAMIGMLGAMADLAIGKAANSIKGDQDSERAADLMAPMGRAMMIGANRSVSYWLSLARILAGHQTSAVRTFGVKAVGADVAGSEQYVARDDLCALFREVGDLTAREARLLQHELGVLSESLIQTLQRPDPSAPYRRRWRAKI
jgi:hypothetical protein